MPSPRSNADQDRLLLRIYHLTRQYAQEMVLRSQDVEDVVQEIAERCLITLRARRWRYAPRDFDLFVRVMVWNHIQKRRRSGRALAKYEMEHFLARANTQTEWMCADPSINEATIDALQSQILETLPWWTQMAYTLVRRHGMSHAKAAAQIGVAPATLNNYIGEAHRCFRSELRARGLL
jgi:DNA-directed RNA polymerase specialized sigma24 family protein